MISNYQNSKISLQTVVFFFRVETMKFIICIRAHIKFSDHTPYKYTRSIQNLGAGGDIIFTLTLTDSTRGEVIKNDVSISFWSLTTTLWKLSVLKRKYFMAIFSKYKNWNCLDLQESHMMQAWKLKIKIIPIPPFFGTSNNFLNLHYRLKKVQLYTVIKKL